MSYSLDFSAVIDRLPELLLACLATIGLAIAGMSLATVIGVLGVVARRSRFKLLRGLVIGFVETIRNTPFLVQIFFIFFALPQIGIKLNPTVTAIIALALNGGAYAIEIIRGGVDSIPKGQVEAGLALGLHRAQEIRRTGERAAAVAHVVLELDQVEAGQCAPVGQAVPRQRAAQRLEMRPELGVGRVESDALALGVARRHDLTPEIVVEREVEDGAVHVEHHEFDGRPVHGHGLMIAAP